MICVHINKYNLMMWMLKLSLTSPTLPPPASLLCQITFYVGVDIYENETFYVKLFIPPKIMWSSLDQWGVIQSLHIGLKWAKLVLWSDIAATNLEMKDYHGERESNIILYLPPMIPSWGSCMILNEYFVLQLQVIR